MISSLFRERPIPPQVVIWYCVMHLQYERLDVGVCCTIVLSVVIFGQPVTGLNDHGGDNCFYMTSTCGYHKWPENDVVGVLSHIKCMYAKHI